MDVTVTEAARRLGVAERTVRAHVSSGRLQVTRTVGRTQLLEVTGVKALERGAGRGRLWSANTTWAALELLDTGSTARLQGSERARLRARLRTIAVRQLAHLASGRGHLRRFALVRGTREQLRANILTSGATRLEDDQVARAFELTAGGSRYAIGYAHDLDRFALRHGLVEDSEGEVILRGLTADADPYLGLSTIALDLYEVGNARESAAGARYLEARLGR